MCSMHTLMCGDSRSGVPVDVLDQLVGAIATAENDDTDDEAVTVSLSAPAADAPADRPSSVTMTITDGEPPAGRTPTVSLSVSPNPVAEGCR